MWVKLFVGLLVVAGITVWFTNRGTDLPRTQLAAIPVANTPEAFVGEGIIVRYQSTDIPTYFLLYENEHGAFIRKELRFTEERGCNPGAGDLPCVLLTSVNPVPVPIGSYVRVSGDVDAQRVVVHTIEQTADSAGRFAFRNVRVGESATGNGMRVSVAEVSGEGGCEVFLGCFKAGIPRVELAIESAGQVREDTLIPGMVKTVPGGVIVLLWGSVKDGEALVALGRETAS